MKKNIIIKVEDGSIAQELQIQPGDILCTVNGQEIRDVFDYRYAIREEELEVLIQKPDGEEWILDIEKDEDEDLGLVFEQGLMDKAHCCRNRCIFCFIDQLPKNLRETLYFKDDDSRLSFLRGNYVTLTNMDDSFFDRIIYYHLSPINISVHATDGSLRKFMMNNPGADKLSRYLDSFYQAGIEMNFQVVLCKGVNDGLQLDKTIEDLSRYLPKGRSLSVVPVGLTKYRDELYPLSPFSPEECRAVVRQVENWQRKYLQVWESRFVYASDEFYIKGGLPLPDYESYEDFPQLENGVGMLTLSEWELRKALEETKKVSGSKLTLVTGKLAYESVKRFAGMVSAKFKNVEIQVISVENNFFGEEITVSGLLTGQDISRQLKGRELGDFVVIPGNALRDAEVFLDDMTILDLERELGLPVKIGEFGQALIDLL